MQDTLLDLFLIVNSHIWGWPLITLLLGTGIYLTVILRGIQFRFLIPFLYIALFKKEKDSESKGDITHFEALMTALSATVGVGNIAGVATAIAIGGPGAVFWMWITGLVGMATKYAEAVLAVKYREEDSTGKMMGGPMYYIYKGLKLKYLAVLFAIFAAMAAFGIGNVVQSHSVADSLATTFNVPNWITGIVLCVATGLVIIGGIKSIGRATSSIVPVMIVFYMLGAIIVLYSHYERIPAAFGLIFDNAFDPAAITGGFLSTTVREGVARGLFSNESGLGSSPIAAAAAKTENPVTQALVSMTQTFIDTIVVCTFTAVVALSSGVWTTGMSGVELCVLAFDTGFPNHLGAKIVAISLSFFAYSTILGWSYYGEKALQFIFNSQSATNYYKVIFTISVFLGAIMKLELAWAFSYIMNGLMAFPNLIGLIGLSKVVLDETNLHLATVLQHNKK